MVVPKLIPNKADIHLEIWIGMEHSQAISLVQKQDAKKTQTTSCSEEEHEILIAIKVVFFITRTMNISL